MNLCVPFLIELYETLKIGNDIPVGYKMVKLAT